MSNNIPQKPYKPLTPFGLFIRQNFPFVEATYEARDNYDLLCKIYQHLKTVEYNQGISQENIEALYNFLNNLDLQEEVNNKLDEMAEDGTLAGLLSPVTYFKSKLSERIIEGTPTTVLFTGDSLTWGQNPATNSQSENPYPKLIQDFIRDWYADNSLITCLNYGVGGAISTNANNNFNTYLAQNPDTIVWAYGTNDVTQLRTNDQIINDLNNFYMDCIDNNIELIVIIPPPNFYTLARREGMNRLHQALLNYCQSRGIIYIDMFDYVNNIYNSNSNTHYQLQTDNTHFINYDVFRDAFISKLLPIMYVQNNNDYNYISIERTPNYVQTNIGAVQVPDVNIFYDALRITEAEGNTFRMNILVKKPSTLYFNGYSNNTAGKVTFTLDSVDYLVDEYSTQTGTTNIYNIFNYKFPVTLKAGFHRITLKNVVFDTDAINRFYMFGFTLEENAFSNSKNGANTEERNHLLWSGNSTSLSAQVMAFSIKDCNMIKIIVGDNTRGFETLTLTPINLFRTFDENNTFSFVVSYNTVGVVTISSNANNNTLTISSTNSVPIRKIYGLRIKPNILI